MDRNDLRFLFAYDRWATEKVLAQTTALDESVWGASGVVGERGLGSILVHMLGAHQRWRHGFMGTGETTRPERDPLPSPTALAAAWAAELDAFAAFVDTVTPDYLASVDGLPIAQMLQHLANHGTQHRSEAALLLTGRSPGDLDMILFAEDIAEGRLPDPVKGR